MNTSLRWSLALIAAAIVGAALFFGGMVFARFGWGRVNYVPAGTMRWYGPDAYRQPGTGSAPYGYGMMGPGVMGGGMMGDFWSGDFSGVKPLSLDEAQAAVEDYLASLGNDDLAVGEVMIFDNHAYAEVVEKSTGVGAFEVLVNPATRAVVPEPGPNMMWNTKYGHMGGYGGPGMMGGMMGGATAPEVSAEMPVSPEEAVEAAQLYLDASLPGAQAEDEVDTFYGYYTIHILRDGKVVGMLSVNGYTGQVWLHTWHGEFVEMTEDAHD
jgi:hypothetical protein